MREWNRIPWVIGRWVGLLAWVAALGWAAEGVPAAREESVFIFGNRRVAFAVPEGFSFVVERNDAGVVGVQIGRAHV